MKVGQFVTDHIGDFYEVQHGISCNECDLHGTCHDDPILTRECGISEFVYKSVKMSLGKYIPIALTQALTEQLVEELRKRGFKGVITKEEVITKTYEL